MTTTAQARVLKGVPTGGQYAAVRHSEAALTLGAPTVSEEFVTSRLELLDYAAHLTPEDTAQVTELLNAGRDFTDTAIAGAADQVSEANHGYTARDARDAREGIESLRRLGRAEDAAAIERVMAGQLRHTRGEAPLPRPTQPEAPDQDYGLCSNPDCPNTAVSGSAHGHTRMDDCVPVLRGNAVPPSRQPVSLPDGKTNPVPSDDPRVQHGEVFDVVAVKDWGIFHRLTNHAFPDEPYSMRIQANRPLTGDETRHLAGLVGYAYRATLRGEPLGEPHSDSLYSFIVSADSTKSSSDDVGHAFEKFHDMLPDMIRDGSPVRTSDRAGAGTKGTRLVEGFNDPGLKVEIYYDSVSQA